MDGSFYSINETGTFWTTTGYVDEAILVLDLFYSSGKTPDLDAIGKSFGASLRLVKDQAPFYNINNNAGSNSFNEIHTYQYD